ncbi:type II toxin-antitoxin system RelE/ParE family toxin [Magnetospirillum sp. 15-1]|uniref:type II toxin-antitoxin system RelE/ParE family toxin n=1 Tax=Magnetospirillum sp. 15-1 TaxID=1979370 RepID=UPI000BBC7A4E|nr:type II toxin-antitoxin system RelE/ParE family toxin [Magnetospirillum sp. 15-1]
MSIPVVFSPEAQDQLVALYRTIAAAASPAVAARYTDSIVTHCEGLTTFPLRGHRRDDIRPGLRITSYRRRTVIAYAVADDRISVIGVFYGGRDYEAALRPGPEE